jgi:hypothetical protein
MPNVMKGINIFTSDVIKDCPYNYGRIVQMLWKEGSKKKKIFILKVFEMMPCDTLKFQIAIWTLKALPPLATYIEGVEQACV